MISRRPSMRHNRGRVGASVPVVTDTLLVYWGQSNTIEFSGAAAPFSTFTSGNGQVWYWLFDTIDSTYYTGAGSGNGSGSSGNSFITATTITTTGAPTSHNPPHLYGLRELLNAGLNVQAIMVARPTTKIYDDWDPNASSGLQLFNVLKHEVDAAIASAGFALAANCRIIWVSYLGEADSTDATAAAAYQARYQSAIDALRSRYSTHQNYFVVVKTHPATTGGTSVAAVRAAQDAVAAANPNTFTAESSDLPIVSNPHLSPNYLGFITFRGLRAALGLRTVGQIYSTAGGAVYQVVAASRVFTGSTTMGVVVYLVKTISGLITQTRELHRNGYNTTVGFNFQIIAPVSPSGSENARLQLDIGDGGSVHRVVNSGNITLQQNKIHQLSFTFDGSNVKFYQDAVQVGATGSVTGFTDGAFNAYIGRYPSGTTEELGIVAVAMTNTATPSQSDLSTALTNAKASDDFSLANQTQLFIATQASNSTFWRDYGLTMTNGYTWTAGATLRLMEASYP